MSLSNTLPKLHYYIDIGIGKDSWGFSVCLSVPLLIPAAVTVIYFDLKDYCLRI